MAIIKIRNPAIDLDAAEIPNLDASKITSGTIDSNRISGLPASAISSGTFADARIAASNVSQHATSFDDNKIVNDISTLGLRVHTQENLNASNTNSASFDVFQDSSGITNLTNAARNSSEYVSALSSTTSTIYMGDETTGGENNIRMKQVQDGRTIGTGGWSGSESNDYVNRGSQYDGFALSRVYDLSQDFQIVVWVTDTSGNVTTQDYMGTSYLFLSDTTYVNTSMSANVFKTSGYPSNNSGWGNQNPSGMASNILNSTFASNNSISSLTDNSFDQGDTNISTNLSGISNYHARTYINNGTGYNGIYINYDRSANQMIHGFINSSTDATSLASSCKITYSNVPTTGSFIIIGGDASSGSGYYSLTRNGLAQEASNKANVNYYDGLTETIPSTGSFEGNAITASSTNKMGAVLTYQDNAGTNTLNTDIILKLSADGGSNYSTATLTALPDFSTGIKMAKVNDLSVTAGTQLKYKIEFANQAAGSKEARIRGVSLQY